jgi:hypothetical protein
MEMFKSILMWSVLLAVGGEDSKEMTFETPTGPATEVVAILKQASTIATADELRNAAREGAALLAPQSPVAEALMELAEGKQAAPELQKELNEVNEDLTFQPLREANLPAGFPTYTPPGVIELKTYPIHRRAVANEFFRLFSHITRNDIAMTAPVRMEYEHADDGKLKQESMAFFYGDSKTGNVGVDQADKDVETVEDKEQTVIALGHRGRWNREVIAAGERRLLDWIKANPEYQAAGDLIVMGYNSPMTPTARQFFEIQLPVEKAAQK